MDNKNLIMGSVTLLVVVIFALILFAPKGKETQAVNIDTSTIKVYKHIEKTKDQEGYYKECKLATDDIVLVKNEFDKAYKLEADSISDSKNINGDYKVIIDDNYLAFDKDNNVVFLGTMNALYNFESSIYNTVIKACE